MDNLTNNGRHNTTQKTKDRATRIPLKTGGKLRCSERVDSFCSTSGTRRVTLVTSPVISHTCNKLRYTVVCYLYFSIHSKMNSSNTSVIFWVLDEFYFKFSYILYPFVFISDIPNMKSQSQTFLISIGNLYFIASLWYRKVSLIYIILWYKTNKELVYRLRQVYRVPTIPILVTFLYILIYKFLAENKDRSMLA